MKDDVEFPTIKPLVQSVITAPDGTRCTIAAFGGETNWSLAPLRTATTAAQNQDFARKVGSALWGIGARRVFAPSPIEFNALVLEDTSVLREHISLLPGLVMQRNPESPADGTRLEEASDAGVFSAGGCSIFIAIFRKDMVFAHAGRDCVIDRTRVLSKGKRTGRKHRSVVDQIMHVLGVEKNSPDAREVHVWPVWSIRPEDFAHHLDAKNDVHRRYNQAAAEYLPRYFDERAVYRKDNAVHLDVPRIGQTQFMSYGVLEENIHFKHAYLHDDLPHTRGNEPNKRYLVAVVRNW